MYIYIYVFKKNLELIKVVWDLMIMLPETTNSWVSHVHTRFCPAREGKRVDFVTIVKLI